MPQRPRLKRATFFAMACSLLAGCTTPIKTPDDVRASLNVESGVVGCRGCDGIKTFTSGTLDSKLYAVKNSSDVRTGQRVSASLRLGATNRVAGIRNSRIATLADSNYIASVGAADAQLFGGQFDADKSHPYRFFIEIHHNSSFREQSVQLVKNSDTFTPIPSVQLEGFSFSQSCFESGCVWDEYYLISAKRVSQLIESNLPLTVFVGDRVSRQTISKDGINKSFETVNAGVFLSIPPDYLSAFLASVKQRLSR